MGIKIAILQSNYIPWRGYFDLISSVDKFVFLDTVQYTKNDWRNRNRILSQNGPIWLSVPTLTRGRSKQNINEVEIDNNTKWQKKHWTSICQSYQKSPFFERYRDELNYFYEKCNWNLLSDLNISLIKFISATLNLSTEFIDSHDLNLKIDGNTDCVKTERIIEVCKTIGANHYLSGPSAKTYLEEKMLTEQGISLEFIDYEHYPSYSQIIAGFEASVSILDLLFMKGPDAIDFLSKETPSRELKVSNF